MKIALAEQLATDGLARMGQQAQASGVTSGVVILTFVVAQADTPGKMHITHAAGVTRGATEAEALLLVRDWIGHRLAQLVPAPARGDS